MSLKIEPAGGALGAEISGIDVRRLTEGELGAIREAFAEHGVIFLRDQTLSPVEHLDFARLWGQINVNRFFTALTDYPEIAEVRKEPEQRLNVGGGWHTDHSYDAEPAMGSILYAREVPDRGGDTLFASMYAAYDALSVGMQENLERLQAVHSSRHVFGRQAMDARGDLNKRLGNPDAATQDAVHPVVIRHPLSGRKALYVNPGFTLRFDGWTAEESRGLLEYLYRFASRPEFTVRFNWRKGSMAFWDNRATWHYALNDYQGERRLMHRITLEGGPLH